MQKLGNEFKNSVYILVLSKSTLLSQFVYFKMLKLASPTPIFKMARVDQVYHKCSYFPRCCEFIGTNKEKLGGLNINKWDVISNSDSKEFHPALSKCTFLRADFCLFIFLWLLQEDRLRNDFKIFKLWLWNRQRASVTLRISGMPAALRRSLELMIRQLWLLWDSSSAEAEHYFLKKPETQSLNPAVVCVFLFSPEESQNVLPDFP